jgi:hypothetical protein
MAGICLRSGGRAFEVLEVYPGGYALSKSPALTALSCGTFPQSNSILNIMSSRVKSRLLLNRAWHDGEHVSIGCDRENLALSTFNIIDMTGSVTICTVRCTNQSRAIYMATRRLYRLIRVHSDLPHRSWFTSVLAITEDRGPKLFSCTGTGCLRSWVAIQMFK